MNLNNSETPGSIIERMEVITLINKDAQNHLSSFCSKLRLLNDISNEDAVTILSSFEFFLKCFIHNIDHIYGVQKEMDVHSNFCDRNPKIRNAFYNPLWRDSDEFKQLNNQISKLRIEKNILLNKLKEKERECLRIGELTDYHVKLLSQVNEINRYFILNKYFKNTKKANAISQTEAVLHKNKEMQCTIIDIAVEIMPILLSQTTYSNLYGNCYSDKGPLKLTNMAEYNILAGWLFSGQDQNVDLLAQRLQETKLPSGVSFAGKGLKLDTADDAQQIVDAINACGTIEYLNLEGNTIGVGAAIAISKALEGQSGLKRALWKDMFTGRLKEEIPKALKALCRGVMKAKAQIEVLDLSDNASGPIGVHGISEFIKSPSCYTLKELRLNNMGLGITGAQMLSNALLECCRKSKEEGNPLKLKVFIAGRNRLEDDGIKSLSRVFRTMKSLEELSIPQNGIYTLGIEELAEALSYNLSLKKLNLNDNTLREGGAKALANSLRNVHDLRSLDIGDCLIKTNGAFAIAEMLAEARNIQEVVLSYNSIKTDGAVAVLEALISNKNILSIKLDGNKFGEQGKNIIRNKAEVIGSSKDILDSLEEDEGSEDDDDDDDDCEEDEEDEEDDEEDDEDDYDEEDESASLYEEDDEEAVELSPDEDDALVKNLGFYREEKPPQAETISAAEFISEPSMENLLALGPNAADRIIEEVKKKSEDKTVQIEELIDIIMSVSSLLKSSEAESIKESQFVKEHKITLECSDRLYTELFAMAIRCNCLSTVHNILPVFLGLIKGEVKNPKPFNRQRSITVIKEAMKKDYFPKETCQLLEFLFSTRPIVSKNIQKGN